MVRLLLALLLATSVVGRKLEQACVDNTQAVDALANLPGIS